MKLTSLPQFKRNAVRFEQILVVLAKYGLAGWVREKDPDFIQRFLRSSQGETTAGRTREERVRMALEELGPTFIKLGQMMSTRADLVGEELAAELIKLQADTPADPPEIVRETIETELGRSADEAFARFNDEPFASASIAQVHAATLTDGTEVVVKVQHAGIEEKVVNDLDILVALAGWAEKYSTDLKLLQPVRIMTDFRRQLMREMDFGREEQNLHQFQKNFEDEMGVHIPRPYHDHSARRVLTMERLDGFSIADTGKLAEEKIDSRELAERGANVFLEMIFRDRFFHADPHPGNIIVLPGNVVGLIDCGMVGYLDHLTKEGIEGLIEGFLAKDADLITDYALLLGDVPKDFDRDELQGRIEILVQDHLTGSLKELHLGAALGDFANVVRAHRLVLKPGFSQLMKVLIMLEGTAQLLSPDFNLAALLRPYYSKMTQRRLSPQNVFHRLRRSYRDWDQFFRILPRDLVDLLQRARKGTLDVHLQHRRLDSVVNRLAFAMLGAALFLGSTMLWSRQIPPLLWGTSVPGVLGTLVSLYLGFSLLLSIRKSGGLDPTDDD